MVGLRETGESFIAMVVRKTRQPKETGVVQRARPFAPSIGVGAAPAQHLLNEVSGSPQYVLCNGRTLSRVTRRTDAEVEGQRSTAESLSIASYRFGELIRA
jgi:hypothetical protein